MMMNQQYLMLKFVGLKINSILIRTCYIPVDGASLGNDGLHDPISSMVCELDRYILF